jgi:hypothetical protein
MIPKYRKKMEKTNITLSLRKGKEIYLVAFNRLVSQTHTTLSLAKDCFLELASCQRIR